MPPLCRVRATQQTYLAKLYSCLNSEFIANQARATAEQLVKAHPGPQASDQLTERLNRAWVLTLCRPPNDHETAATRQLLNRNASDPIVAWMSVLPRIVCQR